MWVVVEYVSTNDDNVVHGPFGSEVEAEKHVEKLRTEGLDEDGGDPEALELKPPCSELIARNELMGLMLAMVQTTKYPMVQFGYDAVNGQSDIRFLMLEGSKQSEETGCQECPAGRIYAFHEGYILEVDEVNTEFSSIEELRRKLL